MLTPVSITYKAVAADAPAGINANDIVVFTQFCDVGATVNTIGHVLWFNATQETVISVNPVISNLVIASGGGGGGGGGGDASAANQVTGNASLASIDTKTPALVSGRQPVDGSGVTQPVSASALPLPAGASTSALQATGNTKLDTINTTLGAPLQSGGNVVVTSAPTTAVTNAGLTNLDVALSTRLKPSDTLNAITSITNALPAGGNILGKTSVDQTTPGTTDSVTVKASEGIGSLIETSPATDTASSGLNGRLQRIAQRLTSIFTTLSDGTQQTKVSDGTNSAVITTSSTDGITGTTNRLGVTSNNKTWNGSTWDLTRSGITGIISTFVGITNTIQHAVYNATRPTLTDGQAAMGQLTSRAALITAPETRSVSIVTTQTVTASSAYTAGNMIGALITAANAVSISGSGIIQSICVTSKTVQTGNIDAYIFTSNPSSTTFTDKATPSINSADVSKCVGCYTLSGIKSGLGTHTIYTLDGIGKAFSVPSGTSIYVALVAGGTPTFGSTSDIVATVSILQD